MVVGQTKGPPATEMGIKALPSSLTADCTVAGLPPVCATVTLSKCHGFRELVDEPVFIDFRPLDALSSSLGGSQLARKVATRRGLQQPNNRRRGGSWCSGAARRMHLG